MSNLKNLKPKKSNFKIALYIRVSTEEQAENPEGSIRNQEDRLRQAVEYKNRNGDFGQIVDVYTDAGISAKDMKRPQLQNLLHAIQNHEVDLVMVTELSRLSRNSRDFIQMWDMMRAYGCGFTSLREDFDTTTAAGEMVLFQLMNLAQFERRQTSERVEANIAARAARGLYNGGCVPVGYKTIPDKPGFLEIDEMMAGVVRTAFTSFLKQGALSPAAIWLNDHGYRLRKDMEGGGRLKRVGHFTVDNLQAMLRNKAYIGIKVYHIKGEKKESKAVWPTIIDELTFQRVGKILDKNRRRYKPHKQGRMPYILTGLCYCMNCNSPMPGKSATGNGGKVAYYEHVWATKRDATLSKKLFKCEPHRVPAKKLEPLIQEKMRSMLLSKSFMKQILEKVRAKHKDNPLRKDEERLKAKIFGVNSQIEALAERLAELPKSISPAPIFRQMERLEEVKKENEEQLKNLKTSGRSSFNRIVNLEKFEDFAINYKHFLKDATVTEKKQILQKFIRKVEVGVNSVKVHWIVDQDHFDRELALKSAGSGLQEGPTGSSLLNSSFFKNYGSYTLTNGARRGT